MSDASLPAIQPADRSGGGSTIKWIAAMAVLTLVAAGLGGTLGLKLADQVENAVKAREATEGEPVELNYTGPTHLRPLAPIVTNLAEPSDVWIRLESSIVVDDDFPADGVLVGQIAEDLLVYLRTVTLPQIEGPSGMQHLREDLVERARIRSDGRVNELVIQTMVIQ